MAWLVHAAPGQSQGKRAVVLAGTGPVGQRAAADAGARGRAVAITGRMATAPKAGCGGHQRSRQRQIEGLAAVDNAARAQAIEGAQIVLATGAAGVPLLDEVGLGRLTPASNCCADANATPPLGIEGIDMMDKGAQRHGKTVFGAIGFGALKISLHRACIARLFEQQRPGARRRRRARHRPHDGRLSDDPMIESLTTTRFLDELASSSATPGGGSAAAVMGAMGAALVSMVANLTIGKKGLRGGGRRHARPAGRERSSCARGCRAWWPKTWPPSTR